MSRSETSKHEADPFVLTLRPTWRSDPLLTTLHNLKERGMVAIYGTASFTRALPEEEVREVVLENRLRELEELMDEFPWARSGLQTKRVRVVNECERWTREKIGWAYVRSYAPKEVVSREAVRRYGDVGGLTWSRTFFPVVHRAEVQEPE